MSLGNQQQIDIHSLSRRISNENYFYCRSLNREIPLLNRRKYERVIREFKKKCDWKRFNQTKPKKN